MSVSPTVDPRVVDTAFSSAESLIEAYRRVTEIRKPQRRSERQLRVLLGGMDVPPELSLELMQEERSQAKAQRRPCTQRDRRRTSSKSASEARALERALDTQLLAHLAPEMLADVVRLEARYGEGLVSFKVLGASTRSDSHALRVADLLIRATLFGCRPAHFAAEDEKIYRILMLGWSPHAILPGREEETQFCHLPFARLIAMARGGNTAARNRLRLLWRAVQRFGYEIEPVPAALWTDAHGEEVLRHGKMQPDASKRIQIPIPCEPKEYSVIRGVVDEEQAAREHGLRIQEETAETIRQARYQSLLAYLNALWEYIGDAQERRVLRADGGDKVEVRVPIFQENSGLQSFAFFREEQMFPGVGVHLYTDVLGYRDVHRMAFTADGDVTGINPTWPNWFRTLLCLMILDAYAWIVVKDGGEDAPGSGTRHRTSFRRGRRHREEMHHVRPFFRALPAGWHASAQAIANAERIAGEAPSEGMTFVCEFDRCYTEFASSRERGARDEWSRQAARRATLVYDEHDLREIFQNLES